VGLLFLYHLY